MNPVSVKLTPVEIDGAATAVLIAACIAVVWAVEVFPTQDGPAHIYMGYVLHHLLSGTAGVLAEYFETNLNYQPNLLVYGVIAALTPVMSADVIEKLIVSLIVAGVPLGGAAIARALGRPAFLGAAALVPIAFSFVLYIGFYNYCLSLIFCLLGIACWIHWHRSRRPGWLVLLSLMSIAAYFAHLFPVANLVLIVGLVSFFYFLKVAVQETGDGPPLQRIWRAFRVEALLPMVALAPAVLAVLAFLATYDGGQPSDWQIGLLDRLRYFFGIKTLSVFGPIDALFSLAVLTVGLAVFLARDRSAKLLGGGKGPWAFAFAAYFLIFLFIPYDIIGSTFVRERIMPFVYVLAFVFLLAGSFTAKQIKIMGVGFAVLATATLGLRFYQMQLDNDHSAEIRDMSRYLEPESTLLVMGAVPFAAHGFLWRPQHTISAWWHWSAVLSTEKNLVNLNIVQANYPIAPIVYREGRNPFLLLPDQPVDAIELLPRLSQIAFLQGEEHRLDVGRFEQATGEQLDYLMIWGDMELFDRGENAAAFEEIVKARFDPIELGADGPHIRLYRRMSDQAPAPNPAR